MDGELKIVLTLKMQELFVRVPVTVKTVFQAVISVTDTFWTETMGVVNVAVNAKHARVLPKIAPHVHKIPSSI